MKFKLVIFSLLVIKIFSTHNRDLLTHCRDKKGNFDREQFISSYVEVR